jgi:hypothetical protein
MFEELGAHPAGRHGSHQDIRVQHHLHETFRNTSSSVKMS